MIKGRYIYEFDLKGFFNNVDKAKVLSFLWARGLSEDMIRQIQGMSYSPMKVSIDADARADDTMFA